MDIKEPLYIEACYTNLERIKKELLCEWLRFPATADDIAKACDEIEVCFGETETFFSGFDGNVPKGMMELLNENINIHTLNKYGLMLERINECDDYVKVQFEMLCSATIDIVGAGANALTGNMDFFPGVHNYYELAEFFFEHGFVREDNYIDYDMLGEVIFCSYTPSVNMPDTAGEYWCNNKNATYEEIGHAVIEEIGLEHLQNPEMFFDYQKYANELKENGNYFFSENGCLDMDTYNSQLGEYLEDILDNELDYFYEDNLEEEIR